MLLEVPDQKKHTQPSIKNEWVRDYMAVDFVVVGTGAGGLAGAIAARLCGLNPLIIEKADVWGGTSALSGGGVWIPNNHLMKRDKVDDSDDEALAYLEATVGEVGPASSIARKRAYIDAGPKMVLALEKLGFDWIRAPKYPDYYQKAPGAKVGRTLEARNFDANRLGDMLSTMRRNAMRPLALTTDTAPKIPTMLRSFNSLLGVLTVVARTVKFRVKGQVPLSMGQALVAQLMAVVRSLDIPVRVNAPLKALVQDDEGRVIAVRIGTASGGDEVIEAPHGVLMAAGGFAKDAAYRVPLQGVTGEWSPASPDDTGDGHKLGAEAGAELALMDAATWYPVSIMPDGAINVGIWERTLPGSIIVDQSGQRYTNEAASYVDAGKAMFDRDKTVPAVPSWLVFDSRYRNRYFFGQIPPRVTQRYVDRGFFLKGDTLEELAAKCGIEGDGLTKTVERVNAMAKTGVDADFDRGDNVYDEYYGDPVHRPNRSFGPLDKAPFYAVRYWPGDLSTKGGLMSDENARVLRADGSVIDGLFVTGNNSAPVMGRTYPGAGATIGPSMVFGWIAAHCAAGVAVD